MSEETNELFLDLLAKVHDPIAEKALEVIKSQAARIEELVEERDAAVAERQEDHNTIKNYFLTPDTRHTIDRPIDRAIAEHRILIKENAALREKVETLEGSIAYAHGRLEKEEACPTPETIAESLRALADERAAWIEVAIDANKAFDAYLVEQGVELPYGMPVDGAMRLVSKSRRLKVDSDNLRFLHEEVYPLLGWDSGETPPLTFLEELIEELKSLRATAEVAEHLLSAGNAMHTCAEASRAYERSDDLADAMDTWENMQALAAEGRDGTEAGEG